MALNGLNIVTRNSYFIKFLLILCDCGSTIKCQCCQRDQYRNWFLYEGNTGI